MLLSFNQELSKCMKYIVTSTTHIFTTFQFIGIWENTCIYILMTLHVTTVTSYRCWLTKEQISSHAEQRNPAFVLLFSQAFEFVEISQNLLSYVVVLSPQKITWRHHRTVAAFSPAYTNWTKLANTPNFV